MRRDLFIALLVSVLLHAGLALSDRFLSRKSAPPAPEEIPTIAITLPPLEPDEPPAAGSDSAAADPAALAPPTQPDVPAIRLDTPFVQPLQPAAPTGLAHPATLITIPVGRPGGGSGSGLGQLFNLADLDQNPEPTAKVSPVYPYEMRRSGITGEVVVGFTVDTEGNVRDATIISSTQREFEASALAAVRQWKFKPGKRSGRAVNARMTLPISFTLIGETP